MNTVQTDDAPRAIGPYSQAIQVDGWLYASGQLPMTPAWSCGRTSSGSWAKCQPSGALVKVQMTSNLLSGHWGGGVVLTEGKDFAMRGI